MNTWARLGGLFVLVAVPVACGGAAYSYSELDAIRAHTAVAVAAPGNDAPYAIHETPSVPSRE